MIDIKDRLIEALTIKGWTGSDLSKHSGISKGQISRYLHGQIIPKQSKIAAMANALGVSPAWLLGYDVDMKGEQLAPEIELDKLTEGNKNRILAYYQALLDSQEEGHGNT